MTDTGKSPRPNHAAMMPSARAMAPAMGDDVASVIAGRISNGGMMRMRFVTTIIMNM